MQWEISNEAAMIALGGTWAERVKAGSVLALRGGLGAGKTQFTKGLASALGFNDDVTSPTFALVHEYRGGRIPVLHFDFYRLERPEELEAIGWDEYLDEPAVVVAEWADRFPELLPPGSVWLDFQVLERGARRVSALEPT